MQKKRKDNERPIVSHCAGLPDKVFAYCDAYASIFGAVQHRLHTDRQKPDFNANKAHQQYLLAFGINRRQCNGVRVNLDQKENAARTARKLHIEEINRSISALKSAIKIIDSKENKTKRELFTLHQKKRRLFNQEKRVEKLKNSKPNVCFGSKKLFNAQHHLEANGYKNHEEWRAGWQAERTDHFMIVGSHDESNGNQNAQLKEQSDGNFSLFLRVAPALVKQFGNVIVVKDIVFKQGRDNRGVNNNLNDIKAALANKEPITVLFHKNKKKHWILSVICRRCQVEIISKRYNGRVGVDINASSLDAAFVDFQGNLKEHVSVPFKTSKSANHDQIEASIGEAVKVIVALATKHKVPVIIEHLDFAAKKKAMKDRMLTNRAILSSFSYSVATDVIKSRAYREGIGVFEVNPAYSSLIGCVKYQSQYGINSGVAAAIVLARRHMRFSERCPLSDRVTPKSPADGLRHVWSRWASLLRNIKTKAKLKIFVRRHDWFHVSGALSTAEVKLMDTGCLSASSNSTRLMGKAKATSALDGSSSANRQQDCSVDVVVKSET
jgi:IS605 OrfB family transposase